MVPLSESTLSACRGDIYSFYAFFSIEGMPSFSATAIGQNVHEVE
jgi:hypothetical protein